MREQDQRPEIGNFEYFFEVYRELGTCRPGGFGASPIPFTAMVEYYKIFGDPQEWPFEDFHRIIRLIDDKFLELEAEKEKAKNKKGKGDKPGVQPNANKNNQNRGGRR